MPKTSMFLLRTLCFKINLKTWFLRQLENIFNLQTQGVETGKDYLPISIPWLINGQYICSYVTENGLQPQGQCERRTITRGEYNSGLHKSSEMKQSSFHTPFLSGFLWLTEH